MGNTGKISYYIGEDGKVHEDRFDGGKGITTVAPSLVGSFQDWLFKTYGKTYNPQNGLVTTGNSGVDQKIANGFGEYLKRQEQYDKAQELINKGHYVSVNKETGAATNADGTPVYYNGNNYDDDPEKVATTTDGNVIEAAFAAAGQKGSVSDVGMGFGEYIKSYGVDTDKAYSQAVRGATNDFYRSLMTYGQRAEGLAGAGLTSSGVSDYGNAAAYAARQGAVATAGAAKLETDAKQAASFAEYIKGVKETALAKEKQQAQERVNLLTALLSSGYDPETAGAVMDSSGLLDDEQKAAFMAAIEQNATKVNKDKQFETFLGLVNSGVDAETAKYVITNSGLWKPEEVDGVLADLSGVIGNNNAELANAYNQFSAEMSAEGATIDGVKAKMKALDFYSGDVIDKVAQSYIDGNRATMVSNIDYMLNNTEYNPLVEGSYISANDLNNMGLDEDTYKQELAKVQKKNADTLMELRNMATIVGDKGKDLEVIYNQLGGQETFGTPYADNEDIQNVIAARAIQLMREKAEEMYNTQSISKEAYIEYLNKDFTYELNRSLEKEDGARGDAVASTLSTLYDYADEEIWEQCLDKIFKNRKIKIENMIKNINLDHRMYDPDLACIRLKIDDKIVCYFGADEISDQSFKPNEKITVDGCNIGCYEKAGNKHIQIAVGDDVMNLSYRYFKETDNKDKTNAIARIVEYYIKKQNNK